MHASNLLLFDQEKLWRKQNRRSMFNVNTGSYDGAEVCNLMGLLILYKLKTRFNNENKKWVQEQQIA